MYDPHGPVNTQCGGRLPDEGYVDRIHFDADHLTRSSGSKRESDAPRTTEQVEHSQIVEIELVVERIEKTLLGKISRRPRLVAGRRKDGLPAQLPADDSHSISTLAK